MNINLNGKTALVCGSSQGIGQAIALQLASQNANVVLFARNQKSLEKTSSQLSNNGSQNHSILVADFSDPESVKNSITKLVDSGIKVHILVNNTGGPAPGLAHMATADDYVAAFKQHLICNQILAQALIPAMKTENYGRVINVISTSVKQPIPALGVSNTIRAAVASWAKTMAGELGPFNITVNNVLPGATETNRLTSIFENKSKKLGVGIDEVIKMEKAIIPMRRFGKPAEFANVVGFLASEAASYINGINLPVDGGRTVCL